MIRSAQRCVLDSSAGSALLAEDLLISDGYRLVRCSRIEVQQWSAVCVTLFGSDPFGSISIHKGIGFNPNSFDFLGALVVGRVIFEPFVFAPRPAHPWSINLLLLNNLAFGGAIHFFFLRRLGMRMSCWGE